MSYDRPKLGEPGVLLTECSSRLVVLDRAHPPPPTSLGSGEGAMAEEVVAPQAIAEVDDEVSRVWAQLEAVRVTVGIA